MSESQPTLPGLEPPSQSATQLERAASRTLQELEAQGLLNESHALLCQLVLELARAVAVGTRTGKASAAAMAAAQLLSAIEALPKPPEGGDEGDAYDQLAAEMRAAADRARADAEAGGTP